MKKTICCLLVFILICSCICASLTLASTSNTLKVSSASATAGQEFSLVLSITSVSKIVALETQVQYDSNAIELVEVTAGDEVFPTNTFVGSESVSANPYYLSWDNSAQGEKTANGVLATLKFKVKSDAYNGEYAVTPIIQSDGAFDTNLTDVVFDTVAGCVTITGGIEPSSPIKTETTTAPTTELSLCPSDNKFTISNSTLNYSSYTTDGKYFYVENASVGQTATFTCKSALSSGSYKVSIFMRSYSSGRAKINVSLNSASAIEIDSNETYEKFKEYVLYDKFSMPSGNFDLKITATSTGKIFLGYIKFTKVSSSGSSEGSTVTVTSATTTTTKSTTSTSTTSTSSSASAPSECVSLSASQVKFVNCKYFAGTIVSGSSESGYLAKMQGGAFNATDKFFGFTFDKTVFDNNPIKFEFTLKTDGTNYGGNYSWFSNSSYTSLQAAPAVSSTTARVNTGYKSISTTGTTFTYDLTSETFLPVAENQFNYFYLCASRVNSSVTAMYLVDFKVYYETGYNVTIDGESVALEGDSLTFPDTADAYISGESLYLAGETAQITQDTDFVSYDLGLSMKNGAMLRLNEVSGIRFCTNIDVNTIEQLKQGGASVQLGTLIAPADRITNSLDFNMQNNDFLDVKFNSDVYFASGNFTGIAGSVANIKDKNANREFVGRGYAIITLGEIAKIVYADYTNDAQQNNARTISFLAKALTEDTQVYELLSATHKQIVDRYFKLYSD